MSDPIQIRMGGYGPPTTTHSRAMKFIGDRLSEQFGDRVDVKYIWNIMDFGYRADEILDLTESGILTLSYQSTSYLTHRVPELEFETGALQLAEKRHERIELLFRKALVGTV